MQADTLSLDPGNESRLFELIDIDPSALDGLGHVLADVASQGSPGIVIRGFYRPEQIAILNQRVTNNEPRHVRVEHSRSVADGEEVLPHYLGLDLVFAKADLRAYLDFAARFRSVVSTIFGPLPPFEARLAATLETLASGRRAMCPQVDDGRMYGPAAIRVFPAGAQAPPHCGNTMLRNTPQFAHLRSLAGDRDQLSFFMLITRPESGGELVLYDLEWEPSSRESGASVRLDFGSVAHRRWQPVHLEEGDLLIFNGGRIYHSVTRVEGTRPRRTIGGFISFAKDDSVIYYYS